MQTSEVNEHSPVPSALAWPLFATENCVEDFPVCNIVNINYADLQLFIFDLPACWCWFDGETKLIIFSAMQIFK